MTSLLDKIIIAALDFYSKNLSNVKLAKTNISLVLLYSRLNLSVITKLTNHILVQTGRIVKKGVQLQYVTV